MKRGVKAATSLVTREIAFCDDEKVHVAVRPSLPQCVRPKQYDIFARAVLPNDQMNDSRVRLRESPDLQAAVLTLLSKGDKADVLDRSAEKQKIENMDSYWCEVRSPSGIVGWVYGAYINIAEESQPNR
jgi:hypothetical protein